MTSPTRKVYFGFNFHFSENAVRVLRDKLLEKLQERSPFVAYSEEYHLFSIECDPDDQETPEIFLNCLEDYVEEQQGGQDLLEIPIVALQDGTFVDTEAHQAESRQSQQEALLDITEEYEPEESNSPEVVSTGSAPNQPAVSISHPQTIHWPSIDGDTSLEYIPIDVMNDIQNTTGANVIAEVAQARVRIDGANAGGAWKKLQNLKPVIGYMNRPFKLHLLILDHIVGDYRIECHITRKGIGLWRAYRLDDLKKQYKPVHLVRLPLTDEFRLSNLWAAFKYTRLGSPASVSKSTDTGGSLKDLSSARQAGEQDFIPVSMFNSGPQRDTYERIVNWTHKTVPSQKELRFTDQEPMTHPSSLVSDPSSGQLDQNVPQEPLVAFDELMKEHTQLEQVRNHIPRDAASPWRVSPPMKSQRTSQNKNVSSSMTSSMTTKIGDRLQETDEVKTRRYYQTMNLQAAKKSKKAIATERQKKLEEAWGPIKGKQPELSSSPSPIGVDMSETTNAKELQRPEKEKLQSREERLLAEEISKQAYQLRDKLQPVISTLRPLKSNITFDVRIGRILTLLSPDKLMTGLYSLEEWQQLFNPSNQKLMPKSRFTKVFSQNGAEIDALADSGESGRLFDAKPYERQVVFEFYCQTKTLELFKIVVHDDGKFEMYRAEMNISTVNLHFPGHVWDASINVSVVPSYVPTESFEDCVKALIKSIYIEHSDKSNITFRVVPNDEFEVLFVLTKRCTWHHSTEHEDVIIKITEIQEPKLVNSNQEPTIWRAQSNDSNEKMMKEGRIHYEMSIMSSRINQLLASNREIEMGDINQQWDEKTLVTQTTLKSFMLVANSIIKGSDGIGLQDLDTSFVESTSDSSNAGPGLRTGQPKTQPFDSLADNSTLGPDDSASTLNVRHEPIDIAAKLFGREECYW